MEAEFPQRQNRATSMKEYFLKQLRITAKAEIQDDEDNNVRRIEELKVLVRKEMETGTSFLKLKILGECKCFWNSKKPQISGCTLLVTTISTCSVSERERTMLQEQPNWCVQFQTCETRKNYQLWQVTTQNSSTVNTAKLHPAICTYSLDWNLPSMPTALKSSYVPF